MPIEETLFHETLLTFATAMVPVLELRGGHPGGRGCGAVPGRGVCGGDPGEYGAGAVYHAAHPPDL